MSRGCRIAVVGKARTTQFQGTIIGSRDSNLLVLTIAAGLGSQMSEITVMSDYGCTKHVTVLFLDMLENIAILQVNVLGTASVVGRVLINTECAACGDKVTGETFDERSIDEVRATIIYPSYGLGDNDSKSEYIIAKAQTERELMGSAGLGIFQDGKLLGIFEACCQARFDLLCIRKLSMEDIKRIERYIKDYDINQY